jgi:hypothetical protein
MRSRGVARRAVGIAASSLGRSQGLGSLNGKLQAILSRACSTELLPFRFAFRGTIHPSKDGIDLEVGFPIHTRLGRVRRSFQRRCFSTESRVVRGKELVGLYGYKQLRSPIGFNTFAQEAIERYDISRLLTISRLSGVTFMLVLLQRELVRTLRSLSNAWPAGQKR